MKRKERMRTITVQRAVTQIEKQCPICRRLFWGVALSRYCGRVCKNRADYARHSAERRRERVENYHAKTKMA
jgi:hypothetical protein